METNLSPLHSFKEQFNFVPEIMYPENLRQHKNTVICGMGGSAICVSLLKMLFPELLLSLHNSYGLPQVYDKDSTLFILNSYSGNTEEILEGYERAMKEGLSCAVLSCGGEIIRRSKNDKMPYIQIPPSNLEPRFSIGYQLIGLLSLMNENDKIITLKEKISLLNIEKAEGNGQRLAETLNGKYPVIYSSSQFSSVAYLIKAAINEGAKIPSFVNIIPESNHNELQSFVTDDLRDERLHFGFLFIQSTYDHERISRRFSVMERLYKKREFVVETIEKDATNIVDIFEVILTGYFLATYLAITKKIDPYKTPFIQEFKSIMSS